MEVTFRCADGQQLSSQWMLCHSEFFREKIVKMVKFGNELRFDYTDYSWASVKFFLDCLHLIPAGPIDIATVVECIAFCQFEGKTTYDSFEVDLVEQLIDSIIKTTLPFGTKLLISAYLDKVDNFTDDRYRQKLAGKVTKETREISPPHFGLNKFKSLSVAACNCK